MSKIDSIINNTIGQFMKQLEEMSQNGSGGLFGGIIKTEVKMSKSKNIFGGSYVELPGKIKINKLVLILKMMMIFKFFLLYNLYELYNYYTFRHFYLFCYTKKSRTKYKYYNKHYT